jgi:hypothetical protein
VAQVGVAASAGGRRGRVSRARPGRRLEHDDDDPTQGRLFATFELVGGRRRESIPRVIPFDLATLLAVREEQLKASPQPRRELEAAPLRAA